MKALSIQPRYVRQIIDGVKTAEYRSWPTKHRGDLLIATCKKPECDGIPAGHAVCIVEITDCQPDGEGGYAWSIDNVRTITPFAVTGKRGFYQVQYP